MQRKPYLINFEYEVTDINGKEWMFKANLYGRAQWQPEFNLPAIEDYSLENAYFHDGDSENDILCSSLSEASSRFPQGELNKLEEKILEELGEMAL